MFDVHEEVIYNGQLCLIMKALPENKYSIWDIHASKQFTVDEKDLEKSNLLNW
jgi:hypothetical protein